LGIRKAMAFTRVALAAAMILVGVSPAAADLSLDLQCNTGAKTMQAAAKQCATSGGMVPTADVKRCLSTHAGDFSQTATTCVNAAENHYEAAATLTGYEADRELIGGATYLGIAAEANIYLGRRDLATAQLNSVIKIASQVKADPHASDLVGMASSELAVAQSLLHALRTSP